MIYFDNSATGGFKPSVVKESAINSIKYLCANPGRSGHRLATTGASIIYKCRETLSSLFSNGSPMRVCFTKNATEALNTAIFGTLKKGGHVITTRSEHNSVLRPLFELEKRGDISLTLIEPQHDILKQIKNATRDNTYLVMINAVSNVTGAENDLSGIGDYCKEKKIIFGVDGAQACGHTHLDMTALGINFLAVAGHKGLYGGITVGVLIFDKNTEIAPLTFGGTGTESFSPYQPEFYPEKLESGTLNLPAIASLGEGAFYAGRNIDTFAKILVEYTATLICGLEKLDGVTLYSTPNPYGIVAFSVDGFSSEEFADILSSDYDIAVRGGLHCAPLMHEWLGTIDGGLVRASLAPQNSAREIYTFISAVKEILSKKK